MDSFLTSSEEDDSDVSCRRRFFDTYRWLHPTELNSFTNWCSSTGARLTNYGKRLDYVMADFGLLPFLKAGHIMIDVEGSDHCPVKIEFSCPVVAALKCPPLCTKYMKQFAGRQQKLASFFVRKMDRNDHADLLPEKPVGLSSECDNSTQDSDGKFEFSQSLVSCEQGERVPNEEQTSNSSSSISDTKDTLAYSYFSGEVGIKRVACDAVNKQAPKKSKSSDAGSFGKQSNLLNFFGQPKTQKPTNQPVEKTPIENVTSSESSVCAAALNTFEGKKMTTQSVKLPEESSSAWKSLLKGPPQAPLCKGHQEPCTLRTVKKDGPNKGKQFWTCARPEGYKTNPDARCDYFVWVSQKKR